MLVALLGGTLLGMWFGPRIPVAVARQAVLAVAAFGGIGLIAGRG